MTRRVGGLPDELSRRLSLPRAERVGLAHDSPERACDADTEDEWLAEILARARQMRDGLVAGVDWDDVRAGWAARWPRR